MLTGRLQREYQTVATMIGLYCRGHHRAAAPGGALCVACEELRDYAERRIVRCPFADDKPTCAKCLVHCYKPDARDRIRQVMRYAGPRMLLHHPWMAARHYWDEWTRKPRDLKRSASCATGEADGRPGGRR